MNIVIVDQGVLSQLREAKHPLELHTPEGKILGHFLPELNLSANPHLGPEISDEELDRRERAGGGRPLSQILADLEKKK